MNRTLEEIRYDLLDIADDLRCDYELNDWADQIEVLGNEMERKIELLKRIEWAGVTPQGLTGWWLTKNLTRDRSHADEMKMILKAGGTTYQGKKIMGSKDEPYIQRFSRAEVRAELTGDWDKMIGGKPEEQ